MSEYNLEYIQKLRIHELRDFARKMGIASPTTMKKEELIDKIQEIMDTKPVSNLGEKTGEALDFFSLLTSPNSDIINDLIVKSRNIEGHEPVTNENADLSNTLVMKRTPNNYSYSSNDLISFSFSVRQNQMSYGGDVSEVQGYLDIHPNGFGIIRYSGFLPDSRDCYLTLALVKKYNLRKGDYIRGNVKYILEDKPRIMFEILEVENSEREENLPTFESYEYRKPDEHFYLDKFHMAIGKGERLYIRNMCINDAVKLGYDIVDENSANVKLINLKALPEECFPSDQKLQIINCPFNKPENEVVQAVELVVERAKREFEMGKSNVIMIYNFSELIRIFNVDAEGFYSYEKFNAKAVNKLTNIVYSAKCFDGRRSITLICIDKEDIAEDMKTLVNAEFMPLFNQKLNMIEILSKNATNKE